jgi:hypothetical protein
MKQALNQGGQQGWFFIANVAKSGSVYSSVGCKFWSVKIVQDEMITESICMKGLKLQTFQPSFTCSVYI